MVTDLGGSPTRWSPNGLGSLAFWVIFYLSYQWSKFLLIAGPPADPWSAWYIVNESLYFNIAPSVGRKWLKHVEHYIQKADERHYPPSTEYNTIRNRRCVYFSLCVCVCTWNVSSPFCAWELKESYRVPVPVFIMWVSHVSRMWRKRLYVMVTEMYTILIRSLDGAIGMVPLVEALWMTIALLIAQIGTALGITNQSCWTGELPPVTLAYRYSYVTFM